MPAVPSRDLSPVALVTGGTAGIGLEACKCLAERGVDVIITSRTEAKGKAAVIEIKRAACDDSVEIDYIVMELSSLKSVSEACEKLKAKKIDYILLNAGIMNAETTVPSFTENQIESTVAVNHVAGTFIALQLLPTLESRSTVDNPRITFVSSDLHNLHSITKAAKIVGPPVQDKSVRYLAKQGNVDGSSAFNLPKGDPNAVSYKGEWSYKYSKLLNVLTATAIQNRLARKKSRVSCNSMEPGFIPASELSRQVKQKIGSATMSALLWCLYKGPFNLLVAYVLGQPVRTLSEGGASEVYALLEGQAGKYYRLDEVDPPSPLTLETENVVDKLFNATMVLLKEKGFPTEQM